MGNTADKGYPTAIAQKAIWIGDHSGPLSYTTGGETVTAQNLGFLRNLSAVVPMGVSVSGNYCVQADFTAKGNRTTCKLIWLYSPLNALSQTAWTQVAAAVNLSGETIKLMAVGG